MPLHRVVLDAMWMSDSERASERKTSKHGFWVAARVGSAAAGDHHVRLGGNIGTAGRHVPRRTDRAAAGFRERGLGGAAAARMGGSTRSCARTGVRRAAMSAASWQPRHMQHSISARASVSTASDVPASGVAYPGRGRGGQGARGGQRRPSYG
jgi:hypothetical protein